MAGTTVHKKLIIIGDEGCGKVSCRRFFLKGLSSEALTKHLYEWAYIDAIPLPLLAMKGVARQVAVFDFF
jgi:hypothetical protein